MKWLAWREKEVLVPCTMSAACSCHAGSPRWGLFAFGKDGEDCSLTPLFLPMDDKMVLPITRQGTEEPSALGGLGTSIRLQWKEGRMRQRRKKRMH
ncbi:hypothetical protein IEQ34_025185 [Dendrobium chrysotoxum]|uniref:Uncharacterized protein n=1 Tax=Dendrobium chrysotoxum TaxID=161865 RepID=A0AAV7FPX1_DENCH|nr:hypothetical protein IEQ34_025185 [Dendrobium chrysotoxum]